MEDERNLYEEKIFDVFSLSDLKEDKITLLSKTGNDLSFEYLNDFWRYEKGKLIQFSDYDSMLDNTNGKNVFDPANGITENYGVSIVNSIEKISYLNAFKDFSLEERVSYIKSEESKKNPNITLSIDPNFQKNVKQMTSIVSEALKKNLNAQELQSIKDMTEALLYTLIVSFTFLKSIKIKNMPTKDIDNIVNDILLKLDKKEINKNSLFERENLIHETPELEPVLKKYDEFILNLKNSNLKNEFIIKEMINKALKDSDILNVSEKIADNPAIQKEMEKEIFKIKEFYNSVKNNLEPNVLKTIENFDENNKMKFINEIEEFNLGKLFKEKGLNPYSYQDQMGIYISSAFLLGTAEDDSLNYRGMMNKYVGLTDNLEKTLSSDKITEITDYILKEIFEKLEITPTQSTSLKL